MVGKYKTSISQEVYDYLDEHPQECNSNKLIRELLQSKYPNRKIGATAVCNATRRWRVKHAQEPPAPSDAQSYPALVDTYEDYKEQRKTVQKKVDQKMEQHRVREVEKGLEDVETDEPTDLFKKVLEWKKYADQEGTPLRVSDIINIMDRTNQLNANQTEIIKDNELIEQVASRIIEFSLSIKKDPDIEDERYLVSEKE